MIILAKDATHAHCIECDNEQQLEHWAKNYDDGGDCEYCGGWTELLLIRAEPLRSAEEDADYLRDRSRYGGTVMFVYEVAGDEFGDERQ